MLKLKCIASKSLTHCGGNMKNLVFKYDFPIDTKGVGFETRTFNEMSEQEIGLLRQADLLELSPVEAWTALGSNIQINYATHGLFRYFGKFPAPVASYLISTYTTCDGIICDPMCGSGTTAVESLLLNRKSCCFDINPLSVLLSKVKVTYIHKDKLQIALNNIEKHYKPLTINEYDWQPVGIKNIDHWFLKETQDSIRGLIKLINDIEDQQIRNFFTICLASCIRTVSRATSQQGRLFLDVLSAKPDALETFIKKAKKGIDRVSNIPHDNSKITIQERNCLEPLDLVQKPELIICHPPYFNSYKYSSVNSLELAWLKINHSDIRKNEVHEFFKVGKAEKVNIYVEDMTQVLLSLERNLEKNGVCALMIGDTVIKGEYIPVTRMIINNLKKMKSDLKVEKVALRVPKFTEASWATSQRRQSASVGITLNDFIIILRKD